MDILVGSTGFVGGNLAAQHRFDGLYHSSDIEKAYGKRPEVLVYAGVPAEMFLANRDPAADEARIRRAEENIARIAPRSLVLISTVAVYPVTAGADEDTPIDAEALPAYGKNRLALERWAEEHIPETLVVRLPAIFGRRLKKNFLYDYIRVIPALLSEAKYAELLPRAGELAAFYLPQGNGFYKCRALSQTEEAQLKELFRTLGFTALAFTDSRSVYQFYPLARLWGDIETARRNGVSRLNLTAEPLSVHEVYKALCGGEFVNELSKPPYAYDLRSRHAALFGGRNGYTLTREEELAAIRGFVREEGGLVL